MDIARKGGKTVDVQLKRGVLEVLVLKVLEKEDSYGYQIVKDVSQCMSVSESTLYPILKRLEAAKLLTVYTVEHNSRLRKYYRITQDGRERIQSFLSDWQEVMKIYAFIRGEQLP